jgi:hypothetical protein
MNQGAIQSGGNSIRGQFNQGSIQNEEQLNLWQIKKGAI